MKADHFILSILLAFPLTGCSTQKNSSATRNGEDIVNQAISSGAIPAVLTWTNYDGLYDCRPADANFILNGKFEGKGTAGFAQVIDDLARLPNKGVLIITYHIGTDKPDRPQYAEPWGVKDESGMYELRGRFFDIIDNRNLRVIEEPVAP